jgi:O-antigen ligase
MQIPLNKYLDKKYLINLLIGILPISFIAGNPIINLNLVLIVLVTLIIFNKKFFDYEFHLIDKFLIILFLFSLITGVINYFYSDQESIFVEENFFKNLLFSRYLLFYFAIRVITEKKLFNFKFFFIICSTCVIFVCLDLILQLVAGADIFGNPRTPYKLSGPFGSEQIAGSYLQRFGIFLFFLIPYFINFKNKNNLIIALSGFFILVFFSILIAGNRMPMILFILMFVMLFLYEKKLRKFSLLFLFSSLVIFFVIFKLSPQIQGISQHFLKMTSQILFFLNDVLIKGNDPNITNTYIKELYSGYVTWKENFIIGGGINSFYLNCQKTIDNCASHPHNYYLEILSELGIIGFIILIIIFIRLFMIVGLRNYLSLDFDKNLIFPFALLFFAEIFPFKTSGSFFTTGNATFIFFIIAIIVSLSKKHNN